MKKIFCVLILLALASLACSLSLTEPTANLSASLATGTAPLSPAATIPTEPTGTATPKTCKVIAEALHLRNAPSIEGLVLAYLHHGDQLTILPDPPSGEWVKVMTGANLTGWINSQYCEVTS